MGELDFNRPCKHEVLRTAIRTAILKGEYGPGDQLPSQNEMCMSYGVSPNTVREAVASLVHEGLLTRSQGKGTFVADRITKQLSIAFVCPHLYNDADPASSKYYDIAPMLLQSVEAAARTQGAGVLLCLDQDSIEIERENIMSLINRGVDGIIIYYIGGQRNIDCLRAVQREGIPIVLIDRYQPGVETDYIMTDHFSGACNAVTRLLQSGIDRVYAFSIDDGITSTRERVGGYRRALRDYGIKPDSDLLFEHSAMDWLSCRAEIRNCAREHLRFAKAPYGVFALNAPMLAGVWDALLEMGDYHGVGLACFEDPLIGPMDDVLVVSVAQPIREIGRRSVQAIMKRISGETGPAHVTLEPEVIVLSPAGCRADAGGLLGTKTAGL